MKRSLKILALIMTIVMVAGGFAACGKKADGTKKGDKLKVVTTIFPQYDFLKEIGKDRIDLTMLLKPGAESHTYEPTPKDINTINDTDLFIYVGGDSDEWVEDILDSTKNKDLKLGKLMDYVKTVPEETVEGMEEEHDHHHDGHHHDSDHDEDADHDHDSDHDHDKDADHDHDHDSDKDDEHVDGDKNHDEDVEYDEHVWTSPKNAIKIVKALTKELGKLDPDNKDFYEKNAKDYIEKLKGLDKELKGVVKDAKRNEIIVGDRFPFRYLVDDYDIKYYAAFPGCATETEASAKTIAFLTDKIKEDKIPVVFHRELSNEKIADALCDATGAKKLLLHSMHNVSQKDFDNGATYLSLMQDNIKALKEALN